MDLGFLEVFDWLIVRLVLVGMSIFSFINLPILNHCGFRFKLLLPGVYFGDVYMFDMEIAGFLVIWLINCSFHIELYGFVPNPFQIPLLCRTNTTAY